MALLDSHNWLENHLKGKKELKEAITMLSVRELTFLIDNPISPQFLTIILLVLTLIQLSGLGHSKGISPKS